MRSGNNVQGNRASSARIRARRWSAIRGACTLFSLLGALHVAEAKQAPSSVSRIVASRACDGCRVVVREVALLSDDTFDTDLSNARVMRTPSGEYLVGGRRGVLGVFDSTFRFRRQLGRSGAGPGEFRLPTQVIPKGRDSLAVFDWALRRLTLYGADLNAPARSLVLPEFRDAIFLRNGELLLSGLITTASAAGFPLHVVTSSGTLSRSFGTAVPRVHRNSGRVLAKSIVRSQQGRILVGNPYRYEIEVWSEDLRLARTLSREVAWFPPTDETYAMSSPGQERPSTMLVGLGLDDRNGNVLATFHTAASDWSADQKLKGKTGEVRWPSDPNEAIGVYLNRYFDTMVEALDPVAMTALASTRLKGFFIPISKSPFLYTLREASDGTLALRIIHVDVVDRHGAPYPRAQGLNGLD